jgi:hypothetical protein
MGCANFGAGIDYKHAYTLCISVCQQIQARLLRETWRFIPKGCKVYRIVTKVAVKWNGSGTPVRHVGL